MINEQEKALLDSIAANPNDDASRSVYADWLEQQGRTSEAEFVRLETLYHQIPARLMDLRLRIGPNAAWLETINRPISDLEPRCSSCGSPIDEGCCWCGTEADRHRGEEHSFVPMGCCCHRDPETLEEWKQRASDLYALIINDRVRRARAVVRPQAPRPCFFEGDDSNCMGCGRLRGPDSDVAICGIYNEDGSVAW